MSGGASARSKTVSSLTNGTTYTFYVRAVNSVGGGSSRSITATPVATPIEPEPELCELDLSATPGGTSVYLSWSTSGDCDPIDGYRCRRDGGDWSDVSGTSKTESGLAYDTEYTFAVQAVYEGGGIGPSDSETVRTPTPPCELSLSASPGGTSVYLSWSTSGDCDITGYRCRRDGGSWSNVGTSTSKRVTGLQKCGSYTFSVQALNGTEVEASDSESATLNSSGSVSLTSTSPQVGEPLTATLTDPDGGITGASWSWSSFSWPRSADSSPRYPELSSYTPTTSDEGNSLQASVSYTDGCGMTDHAISSFTSPVTAASAKPVSLQAMPDSVLAAIAAPNPFNPTTTLHIQLPASGPVSLTIYNIAGQVVRTLWDDHELEAGYHTIDWDSRDQQGHPATSGVYLYQLRTSKQILLNKMVLIR